MMEVTTTVEGSHDDCGGGNDRVHNDDGDFWASDLNHFSETENLYPHSHSPLEELQPVAVPIYKTSYFQCPLCEEKFSNETGAWQHCFMWHDEFIQISQVRTWEVATIIGDDEDADNNEEREEKTDKGSSFVCDDNKTEASSACMATPLHVEKDVRCDDKSGPILNFNSSQPHAHIPPIQEGISIFQESSQVIVKETISEGASRADISKVKPLLKNLKKNVKAQSNRSPKKKEELWTMDYLGRTEKCTHCCEIVQKGIVWKHLYVHKDASLPCSHCGGLFAKSYQLHRHMEKAHHSEYLVWREEHGPKPRNNVSCPDCSEVMQDGYRSRMHARLHKDGARFSCPEGCKGKFPSNTRLETHLRIGHRAAAVTRNWKL